MTKGYHVKANKKSLGLRLPMYNTCLVNTITYVLNKLQTNKISYYFG